MLKLQIMPNPTVTERSYYNILMDVISEKGGQSVQEVRYNSVPDIVFEIQRKKWILSVKIGEDTSTIKSAFLQYLRHKEESNIPYGILLILPESSRRIPPHENVLRKAINDMNVTALIDADFVKEELRDRPFPAVIDFLTKEILIKISEKQKSYFSLDFVIKVLQQHLSEMMREIDLKETAILKIITDRKLLSDLGHLSERNSESVAKFLASYIFLSQILFLRLLATANPGLVSIKKPISKQILRRAFEKILEINYRPIYEVDVMDSINKRYLEETFEIIWGLQIEHVRDELPGRIFHELMPWEIRKMLAAFYTRPRAADLLAHLSINDSSASIFDPACGSGTILASAYKRKYELHQEKGKHSNPHKAFCEHDIFGADIMPFAVHLTSANLSAMDPATLLNRTQIIQGDSMKLTPKSYPTGLQTTLFSEATKAQTSAGHHYDIDLNPVDVILMNPPFTKVERGIRKYVDMTRFNDYCGGEVGLWGHFIALSKIFLKEDGIMGAVIPINILRGRESAKIRAKLFQEWTPLYIFKPTLNYGFSEWSEYRDTLIIAKNTKPRKDHKVKFCLVKKDLTLLTNKDVEDIAEAAKTKDKLRTNELVDINSYSLDELADHFDNMMWFCGGINFSHRDIILAFISKTTKQLSCFPEGYFREGFRPVPEGVSQFLFITRHLDDSRIAQAFLSFDNETDNFIKACSPLHAEYKIGLQYLTPSLRTATGIQTMDISNIYDYIASSSYPELARVCCAANIHKPGGLYWGGIHNELSAVSTNVVVSRRINPFSPSTHLVSFYSEKKISPSNQVNVITEKDPNKAKAVCSIFNSIIFLAYFFLLKEESTGRYIDIRFYDLYQMMLYPTGDIIIKLNKVYNKYKKIKFPSLSEQLDRNYQKRYESYWSSEDPDIREAVLSKVIQPFKQKLEYDLDVCNALGIKLEEDELLKVYDVIIKEMMITRGLGRD